MPSAMADFVTTLRTQLLDSSIPYLWSDAVLHTCVQDAVNQHSFLFPRQARQAYDVLANQVEFSLLPNNITEAPDILVSAEVIAVVGVELPPGNPIPLDSWSSTKAANSTSSRTTNGYRWQTARLRLRKAATGGEVGTGFLIAEVWQSWNMPDDISSTWNGPLADYSLVIMLAKREAYQLLAEWQAREQGIQANKIALATGAGSTEVVVAQINVDAILASLEIQIARALTLRARRSNVDPALYSLPDMAH